MTDLRVDERELTELLQTMVRIPSVNGDLRPEIGEGQLGDFVADYCAKLGLPIHRQTLSAGRDNVYALLEVPGATKTLLLDSHLDTMPLESMGERALSAEIRDGLLYGRGACDDKGPLAAMLYAVKHLVANRRDLKANVLLLGTVGEEQGLRGAKVFHESGVKVDAAVCGEPTDLDVIIAHKGFVWITLTTHGKAAHSSTPELGDNAIYQMADVIAFVRNRLPALWADRSHPLLGGPTVSLGLIAGGTAINIVPDTCTIKVDRRTIPGEDLDAILTDVDAALDVLRAAHPEISVTRAPRDVASPAVATEENSPLVQAALRACQSVVGRSKTMGVRYGTNASIFAGSGDLPFIVFGPGSIAHAHTANEFVPLDEVFAAARIYAKIATEWAG
jgi:putative selenium metabolism hydrolase